LIPEPANRRGIKQGAGTLSPETILGIVSLILWSLILIISLEYAILIMRADNHGEAASGAPDAARCQACGFNRSFLAAF
jgi:potassium transporter